MKSPSSSDDCSTFLSSEGPYPPICELASKAGFGFKRNLGAEPHNGATHFVDAGWYAGDAGGGRVSRVEKVLLCIARSDHFQALAAATPDAEQKAEYLKLACMWLDMADACRTQLREANPQT